MISHSTPSRRVSTSNPIASGSRIQNKLVFAMLLVVLVAIFLLEAVHRLEVNQADQWQLALRMFITSATITALALALALYIARGWVKQVASIKRTLEALAEGDPSVRAEVLSDDELGAIAVALNRWHDEAAEKVTSLGPSLHVNGSPGELIESAVRLSTSVSELQVSTDKLSQESEADLAQINDTSSAVDEIVESIRQVAENTSTSAKVAAEGARDGHCRFASRVEYDQGYAAHQEPGSVNFQTDQTIGGKRSANRRNRPTDQRCCRSNEPPGVERLHSGRHGRRGRARIRRRRGRSGTPLATLQRGNETDGQARQERPVGNVGGDRRDGGEYRGSCRRIEAGEPGGRVLADIDAVSDRLAELINAISNAAKQQVRGGLLASRSMNEISAVIHDKALGTRQAAQSVTQLASLASRMLVTVQRLQVVHSLQPQPLDSAEAGISTPEKSDAGMPGVPPAQPGVEWSSPVATGSATR